jgi:6-pyruvoyltetrahydropterin/6-carboxytetrahydropterin synthase
VTLSGIPIDEPGNPKNGMVIDFTDLKSIIKKEIVNVFDHAVAVSKRFDKEKMEMFTKMFGNTVLVDYQPTCENLVEDFAKRITRHLPSGVKLHNLKLYETATSFAEWFASDNE